MKRWLMITGMAGVCGLSVMGMVSTELVWAQTARDSIIKDTDLTMVARLDGYQEVPAISTKAHGAFKARLIRGGKAVEYALAYSNLEGRITQAHIHFGRTGTNGGIIVFLCQNGINQDPASRAPVCPQEGSVEGVISEDNILGPAGQGIEPGAYREFLQAVLARAAYVNVHSSKFTSGEIRGQIGTSQLAVDITK